MVQKRVSALRYCGICHSHTLMQENEFLLNNVFAASKMYFYNSLDLVLVRIVMYIKTFAYVPNRLCTMQDVNFGKKKCD